MPSLIDKPRLMEKLKNFHDYVRKNNGQIGTKQRGIDLNFNNACNLTCKYCFTNSPIGDHAKDTLDLDMVASIADQADELGIFEFDLQGGELLLRPELLFQVLEAIQPERFYLYLTTNGYFLDKEMAQRRADAKVGRVSVSIDSFDEKTHDEIRGRKDSWRRAMDGLKNIQEVVSIPVMAKCRIGHFAEAQILEALEVDFIDESEVLTPADDNNHIYKNVFKTPFVCGARNLGEALRRIGEGAAMIRTKGEAGSGNIVEAVRHMRSIINEIQRLSTLNHDQLMSTSRDLQAPFSLVEQVAKINKLPVPNFSAGGIATPADVSLVMQLGAESVFVGSGIFKSEDPVSRAKAIVESVTYYQDPNKLAEVSEGLKSAMKGLEISEINEDQMMQERGW